MKRIAGVPECPLCRKASEYETAFFPAHTDGLPIDPVHHMFHPVGFHWDCYLSWCGRRQFASSLYNRLVKDLESSTLNGCLYADGDFAVFASVNEPFMLTLLLRETGRKVSCSIDDWLETGVVCSWLDCCHPTERELFVSYIPPLMRMFPDSTSISASTDWSGTERHLYAHDGG